MGLHWTQKIGEGMDLIVSGCKENTEWNKCEQCPFGKFCDALMEVYGGQTPEELFVPEDEDIKIDFHP